MSVSRPTRFVADARAALAASAATAALAAWLASLAAPPAAASPSAAPRAVPDVAWTMLESGPELAAHVLAYDPRNDVVWLYGGIEYPSNRVEDDLYRLDASDPAARWQLVNAGGIRPPALALPTLTYDPVRERLLLYGGLGEDEAAQPSLVWALDVADPAAPTWSRHVVTGNQSPRFGHAAAYVGAFDALVVSGGFSDPLSPRTDAWALVLGPGEPAWVRMANAGFVARGGHALIHDAQRQRLVAFGGINRLSGGTAVAFMDTLDLSGGLDAADRWRRLSPQTPIGARAFMATGWDDSARLWWFQGGVAAGNQGLVELVVADLGPDQPIWTNTLTVARGPSARFLAGSAWDDARDRLIVHGGTRNQQQLLRDAYALSYLDPGLTPSATTPVAATATATTGPTATSTATTVATPTPTIDPSLTPPPTTAVPPTSTATTAPTATSTSWATHLPPTATATPPNDPTATATRSLPTGPSAIYLPVAYAGAPPPTATTEAPTPPGTATATPPDEPTAPVVPTATSSATASAPPTPTPTPSLVLIGRLGGTIERVASGGERAFAVRGLDVLAIDATGGTPTEVGRHGPLPRGANALTASGSLVAVAHDEGVELLVVAADGTISPAARLDLPFARSAALEGTRLLVGDGQRARLYDASDPAIPRPVDDLAASGTRAAALRDGLALVAHDTALLVARAEDDALVELARLPLPSRPYGVALGDGLAAVALGDEGTLLVDLSDPAAPAARGTLPAGDFAGGVALDEATLWVADERLGLASADVSDPDAPAALGALASVGQQSSSVALHGGTLLLSESNGGVSVVDGADPAAPRRLGRLPAVGRSTALATDGDLAAVAFNLNGIGLVDAGDPAEPRLLGTIPEARQSDALALDRDLLISAEGGLGVAFYDVADPASPAEVGRLRDVAAAADVAVLEPGRVLVANRGSGLAVVDATDPANPALAAELALGDEAVALDVDAARDLAAVATGGGLVLVDVADPLAPTVVGTLALGSGARDVDLAGTRALLATASGLVVADVADPAAPAARGALESSDAYAVAAAVGAAEAWLATFRRIVLVDLTDPDAPVEVAIMTPGGRHFGAAARPEGALFAGDLGLLAIGVEGR